MWSECGRALKSPPRRKYDDLSKARQDCALQLMKALRFLYDLRHYTLCAVGRAIWGTFSPLQIAVLAVNCMSDGAVEVMTDRGQSLAAGRARIAAKSAHEFASGGIYVITIDFGNGTHGVYVGKSDKDIRHPMSGHDSAARAEESDRSESRSLVVQTHKAFPTGRVCKVVLVEHPERSMLLEKLERGGVGKRSCSSSPSTPTSI